MPSSLSHTSKAFKEVPRHSLAISIAPATAVIDKPYYDLLGIITLMKQLRQEGLVDGFEFQNLAEWDATNPPRDEGKRRLGAWHASQKYSAAEITVQLQDTNLPILSVHANRDVGICLCSDKEQDIQRGQQLMHESLLLAENVGAAQCTI